MHNSRTVLPALGTGIAAIALVFAGLAIAEVAPAHAGFSVDNGHGHSLKAKRDTGW